MNCQLTILSSASFPKLWGIPHPMMPLLLHRTTLLLDNLIIVLLHSGTVCITSSPIITTTARSVMKHGLLPLAREISIPLNPSTIKFMDWQEVVATWLTSTTLPSIHSSFFITQWSIVVLPFGKPWTQTVMFLPEKLHTAPLPWRLEPPKMYLHHSSLFTTPVGKTFTLLLMLSQQNLLVTHIRKHYKGEIQLLKQSRP